jgi:glucose-1-phosphate adenylyltransferase
VVGVNARIHSWAAVEGAVLLDGVQIGRRARVRRAILDRGVSVPANETLGYDDQRDRERFVVTPGGVTVVSRAAAESAWAAPA